MVGATLAGIQAANNPNADAGSIVAAVMVGGLSNLIPGKGLLQVSIATLGNIAGQSVNPCFAGFDFSETAAAGLLGGLGVLDKLRIPGLLPDSNPGLLGNTILQNQVGRGLTGLAH